MKKKTLELTIENLRSNNQEANKEIQYRKDENAELKELVKSLKFGNDYLMQVIVGYMEDVKKLKQQLKESNQLNNVFQNRIAEYEMQNERLNSEPVVRRKEKELSEFDAFVKKENRTIRFERWDGAVCEKPIENDVSNDKKPTLDFDSTCIYVGNDNDLRLKAIKFYVDKGFSEWDCLAGKENSKTYIIAQAGNVFALEEKDMLKDDLFSELKVISLPETELSEFEKLPRQSEPNPELNNTAIYVHNNEEAHKKAFEFYHINGYQCVGKTLRQNPMYLGVYNGKFMGLNQYEVSYGEMTIINPFVFPSVKSNPQPISSTAELFQSEKSKAIADFNEKINNEVDNMPKDEIEPKIEGEREVTFGLKVNGEIGYIYVISVGRRLYYSDAESNFQIDIKKASKYKSVDDFWNKNLRYFRSEEGKKDLHFEPIEI